MFKEWEDYVLAATAIATILVVGKAVYDEVESYQEFKAESAVDWMELLNKRYDHVSDKLRQHNASNQARVEAYRHAHMLNATEIDATVTNQTKRASAHRYNDKWCNDLVAIWSN